MLQFPPPGSHLNRRPGPIPSPLAPRRMPEPVPVLLLGFERTMNYLRSAALGRAMAESCTLEWKSYDESTVLNAIYTLLPWKEKPGSVEMKMARGDELGERYGHHLRHLVSGWTTAMFHGAVATKTFLDRVESRKARDAAHIEQVAQDVREINAQVVGELTSAINNLAAIKLGSTIAIAALSGGASIYAVGLLGTAGAASAAAVAATAGMINTAYSVTGSLISNWHKAASAKVVGVTIEGAKAVGGKLAGDAGENMFKQGAAMVAANQEAMIAAAEKMTLARNGFISAVRHKSRAHSLRAMAKAGDEVNAAARNMQQGRAAMGAGSRLAVGAAIFFAAVDVIQGICEYQEDTAD